MMRSLGLFFLSLLAFPVWAVDSYRYLHVTIDTPWAIFLFLLPLVLSPFLLMIILYWRYALKKAKEQREKKTKEREIGK